MRIPIYLQENTGIDRVNEPVTIGVPISRGIMYHNNLHVLKDTAGRIIPVQITPMAMWPDKTYKWIILDCQLTATSKSEREFSLNINHSQPAPLQSEITINEDSWEVDTGSTQFRFNTQPGKALLTCMKNKSHEIGALNLFLTLYNDEHPPCQSQIKSIKTELKGPLRSVIKIQGIYIQSNKTSANFTLKIHFFAGKSFIKVETTLHNPKPAKHQGGLWDLGDCGSLLIKEFTADFHFNNLNDSSIYVATELGDKITQIPGKTFSVFQGSSGGPNWNSSNHITSEGKISLPFQGYRTFLNKKLFSKGKKATPLVYLGDDVVGASCFFPQFWQNFPKAVEAEGESLKISLFPDQNANTSFHELQGGEQKTHVFFMNFGLNQHTLNWLQSPLQPWLPAEWYSETKTVPYLVSNSPESKVVKNLIMGVIESEHSFFKRREIIDEYGWRNFGDTYADHEAIGYKGHPPLISHYNNQYDLIYSLIRQYMIKSSPAWQKLFEELAKHVMDIDIYRTTGDRTEFNGGYFWHTDHYLDAATATHRTVSKAHLQFIEPQYCGGGPGLEHNYTTGLMYYYYLTGNTLAKETVLLLANWVRNLLNLPETVCGCLFNFKKNISIYKEALKGRKVRADKFPFTRGSGNSINTLLDAYTLTESSEYLRAAEFMISGCIHPHDDIESRNLLEAEDNWSYTVCLQAIGKYLDVKIEREEFDAMYGYAKKSLLQYAKWMAENEYLYLEKAGQLEYPNETWPTQDLRKSCIFYFAAKHSKEEQKNIFSNKATAFFDSAIAQLDKFETKTLTRPLALLMQNYWMHQYFIANPEESAPCPQENTNFPHKDEFWQKKNIVRYCTQQLIKAVKNTSIKKEIHWINCRRNRHI